MLKYSCTLGPPSDIMRGERRSKKAWQQRGMVPRRRHKLLTLSPPLKSSNRTTTTRGGGTAKEPYIPCGNGLLLGDNEVVRAGNLSIFRSARRVRVGIGRKKAAPESSKRLVRTGAASGGGRKRQRTHSHREKPTPTRQTGSTTRHHDCHAVTPAARLTLLSSAQREREKKKVV